MKVTNTSKALQGVNTKSGRVFIRPGDSKDLELEGAGLKQAKRLKFLSFGGGGKGKKDDEGDDTKSAAEVLGMADGNFMAFKSAASKLLGDATPSKKDEIIAALEDMATRP